MRRALLPFLSLAVSFLIVAHSDAAGPIRIGIALGLTGKYSEMSTNQMKGFRLWEKEVNKAGGILGRPVTLTIYDNKSDPQTTKSLYEHLITKDRVDLLFAPYSSGLTEAILPVVEKYGYPILASGASADSLWQKGSKYIFGVYIPASRYTVGFLEMLVKQGIDNLAIVYADDPFSKDTANGTRNWATRFGLKVLLYEGLKKGTENFDDVAGRLKAANPSVLIVCGYLTEAVNIRLSLKAIGWSPRVYYASVGPASQAFYDKLGTDGEHAFSSSQWEYQTRYPGSEAFYETYVKTYGEKPSYHAATAYAAGEIMGAAVRKAESLDKERIREILAATETMTIIGRYGVDRTGRQVKHFPIIIQWQRGKREIVWPDDLKTSRPVFR